MIGKTVENKKHRNFNRCRVKASNAFLILTDFIHFKYLSSFGLAFTPDQAQTTMRPMVYPLTILGIVYYENDLLLC